ncbi:response regulator transcription factor [Microlunatus parietis]|uniref:DNA-binding response OmpR family regulator n=1 Tax=Microlunatus parietis TaxID=682979 RepID=A0A7Y9I6G2_9ACTN|nr:response regulator transcription factor [Microlunatus parietis]NYE70624.1 DNA-binding response OmpR family regulator [Microlunatus parietis]
MPDRVAVIIEDDADIRNLLEAILAQAGFTTHAVSEGADGVAAVRDHQPILTTLDISLPGIDGFEVARQIRHFSDTYIIILSARTEEVDTLMGLDAGADDYLTKPFRPRELRARVEAMMRRRNLYAGDGTGPGERPAGEPGAAEPATASGDGDGWLSHNGLRIHPEMRLCELDGSPVTLTRSEFDLLQAIMNGKRRVVSKDTLSLELRGDHSTGGYVSESDRRAVEVHLANVRRKLNDPVNAPRFIETVRGVGYRLATRQPQS